MRLDKGEGEKKKKKKKYGGYYSKSQIMKEQV